MNRANPRQHDAWRNAYSPPWNAFAKHPHLGRPGREPETRELIVAGMPYIIPYRIHRDRLAILAVLHAAQDELGK